MNNRRKLVFGAFGVSLLSLLRPVTVQAATTQVKKYPWVGPSGKIEGYIIQTIYLRA